MHVLTTPAQQPERRLRPVMRPRSRFKAIGATP